MNIQLKGQVVALGEVKSGISKATGNSWTVASYIIKVEGDETPFNVTVFNDKFKLEQGQNVDLQCDLSSREYNGKYYMDLRAWKVNEEPAPAEQPKQQKVETPISAPNKKAAVQTEMFDNKDNVPFQSQNDLPF